jgi:hypothetical protein
VQDGQMQHQRRDVRRGHAANARRL